MKRLGIRNNITDGMTKEQEKLRDSWLQILAILKEHGYDSLYQEDILRVADVVRKEIGFANARIPKQIKNG